MVSTLIFALITFISSAFNEVLSYIPFLPSNIDILMIPSGFTSVVYNPLEFWRSQLGFKSDWFGSDFCRISFGLFY